jgi:hypothetical protein
MLVAVVTISDAIVVAVVDNKSSNSFHIINVVTQSHAHANVIQPVFIIMHL